MFEFDDLWDDSATNPADGPPADPTPVVKAATQSPNDAKAAPKQTVAAKPKAKPKVKAKAKQTAEDRLAALMRAEQEQAQMFMQMMGHPQKPSQTSQKSPEVLQKPQDQPKPVGQLTASGSAVASDARPSGPSRPPPSSTKSFGQAATSLQQAMPKSSFASSASAGSSASSARPAPVPSASSREPVPTISNRKPPTWEHNVDPQWNLPTIEFMVMEASAMAVKGTGNVAVSLKAGELLTAVEETFDGWLRIVKPFEGWALGDDKLEILGAPELVVASEHAHKAGVQQFEVAVPTGVDIFPEPFAGSVVKASRAMGEFVNAETQTFHGWIRLANGEGWMQGRSHRTGELLTCVYMQEQSRGQTILYRQNKEQLEREAAAEAALARERARSSDVWAKLAESGIPDARRGGSRRDYFGVDIDADPAGRERAFDRKGVTGNKLLDLRGGSAIQSKERGLELEPKTFEFLPEGEVFRHNCGGSGLATWNHGNLPVQEFRIVNTDPAVRTEPKFSASVCGKLKRGERAQAVEETFDGWVKLADQPGWAPRDMGGRDSIRECLEETSRAHLLAVPDFSPGAPSRMMFEVVFEPRVNIMSEPHSDASILGSRGFGQFVLAESQTYHGWVRLADSQGWMQNKSQKHGQLLCSVTAAEHAEPMLALGGPGPGEEEGPTEEEKRQQEQEEKERAILAQVQAQERQEALAELEAAAGSGEGAIFRTALKAAKKAGVNKKDIARLNAQFSLSSC